MTVFKSTIIAIGNFPFRLFFILFTVIEVVLEAYAFVGAVGKTIYSFFFKYAAYLHISLTVPEPTTIKRVEGFKNLEIYKALLIFDIFDFKIILETSNSTLILSKICFPRILNATLSETIKNFFFFCNLF